MKKLGCFLVFTCVLSGVAAYAESDFTIYGSFQKEGKLNIRTASQAASTTSTFNPANFGSFGLRIGHGNVFGGEHTIGYAPNFIEANTKAIVYNSNVLVQAPLPKAKPYLTAGLGSIFSFGTDDSGRPAFGKIGSKWALNYGGGLKVLPAGPIGVRFDIRGYMIPSARFNVAVPTLSDPLATIKSESQTLNILEAGIGIVFSFRR